ncbi:MAG: hypothetical protein ACX939_01865 [Hyphococcus sp.]
MKKSVAKASLVAIETLAVLLAICAAGTAYVYWRLERGPVSLSMFKPSVESAIARRLPEAFSVSVGGVELVRQADGEVAIRLIDLDVRDGGQNKAAAADELSADFRLGFYSGEFGPRRIRAKNAEFLIVRNDQRRVKIPAAQRRDVQSPLSRIAPIFDQDFLKSAFERADIEAATLRFYDEASERSWVSKNASVKLVRDAHGLSAAASGDIIAGAETVSLDIDARYTEQSGVVDVSLAGTRFPLGDILTMFYGGRAEFVDAPVSGEAVISLTSRGEVLSSRLSGMIEGGYLNLASARKPINFIRWLARFDPEENRFDIEELEFDAGGNRGAIEGAVAVAFDNDLRAPSSVSFDLTGRDLVVDVPRRLPEALPVNQLSATGAYRLGDRRIALNRFDVKLLDIGVHGNAVLAFPRKDEGAPAISPQARVNLVVDGALDPQRLLRIWPLGVAMGARDWIEERVETAVIENIEAVVDLAAGGVGDDGLIPDEAMSVTFDVRDAKAYFVRQMTPITKGAGAGVLRGNSFTLTVDEAMVGDIAINQGEVDFPVFIPKWQPTYIRFTADGKSE